MSALPSLPLHWGQQGLPAAPRRLLIVQLSAMGDQVQTLPAVSDIAARWPDLIIDWAVDARFAAIPRRHPAVDQVFALPLKQLQQHKTDPALWRQMLRALRALRGQRYDLIWDPQSVMKSALISRLARGRLRVGYRAADCGGEPQAAHCFHLHFTRPTGIHGTEGRRLFAAAVLQTDPNRPVQYRLQDPAATSGAGAPPYAVLAHGASKPNKLWPTSSWSQLGTGLIEKGLKLVLPWGNAAERERAEQLIAAWPRGAAALAQPGDLDAMTALLAGASLVVGVDSGFSHLAAALRRPLVMLFTATGPELFSPEVAAISRTLGGPGSTPTPEAALDAVAAVLAQPA